MFLIMKKEKKGEGGKAHRKTVYKETKELISDTELNSGDTSSVFDMGRNDFVIRPRRRNRPLGSGHEPGTIPG